MRAYHYRKSRNLSLSVWIVTAIVAAVVQPAAATTPLDDYVAAVEPNYARTLNTTIPGAGYTAYVLDLTSQDWRSLSEVNRTQWHHWLTIVKPDTVDYDKAMLFIGGGNNGDAAPGPTDEEVLLGGAIATATNSVVAYLQMVPNQSLTFTGDPGSPRSEDSLIAYTWDQYMQSYVANPSSPDEYWPAQLPMTKSATQAMTAIQDFSATAAGGSLTINNFSLTGGSKRGWTTWLAAAVDPRVTAIAPMVIDVLNVEESMKHHYDTYGFWAPAISDYVEAGVMNHVDTPEFQTLMDIVDPYVYRDRLTMPKYIINSTGDEFFLPDSSQFYYDDLPGEKYLRYVPNTSHSLEQEALDVLTSVTVFHQSQLENLDLPDFSWTMEEDGSITIEAETIDTLLEVNLWQATNPNARDFRYDTIGAAWTSSLLADEGGGIYLANLPNPADGWTAFFAELIYDNTLGSPYKFTTQVMVVPEPATLLLTLAALASLLAISRRH